MDGWRCVWLCACSATLSELYVGACSMLPLATRRTLAILLVLWWWLVVKVFVVHAVAVEIDPRSRRITVLG